LPRDVWKTGVKENIDTFIKKNPPTTERPSVLGLECFDEDPKESKRIHHFHQDRNVSVRLQRYEKKGPGQ
jgi:hypothetical protein